MSLAYILNFPILSRCSRTRLDADLGVSMYCCLFRSSPFLKKQCRYTFRELLG